MEIEYKNKIYKFYDSLSFKKIQKIIEGYNKAVFFETVHWWYRKTDFGYYFLKKILKTPNFLPDIPDKDWYIFIPALKNFFPTITQQRYVVHNVRFIHGLTSYPIEDSYFLKYLMLEEFASLTLKEIENMNYKDFRLIYHYIIGDMIYNLIREGKKVKKELKGIDKFRDMVT